MNMLKTQILAGLIMAGSIHAQPVPTMGALAPENLNKQRPKPAFDITGTWLHDGRRAPFQFAPPADAKLTPAAKVHFEAAKKARGEGMPITMTLAPAGPLVCR